MCDTIKDLSNLRVRNKYTPQREHSVKWEAVFSKGNHSHEWWLGKNRKWCIM